MAEPRGLIAGFASAEALVAAAKEARAAGLEGIDAFTPFPVDELNQVLAIRDNRIPWLGLAGGVFGLVAAYAMQIAVNLDYRLDIGGRPAIAMQGFALIGFELLVLFAVLFMVAGFFVLNRLPRYHHPLFWVDRFEHATRDLLFLFVPTADAEAMRGARDLLERLQPASLDEVPG